MPITYFSVRGLRNQRFLEFSHGVNFMMAGPFFSFSRVGAT
jgi:hypothetical protein